MKTNEIIQHTRIFVKDAEKLMLPPGLKELLTEAADRLEELDERVAIMNESKTGKWQKEFFGGDNDAFWYRCPRCRKFRDYPEKYCPNCGMKMEGTEHEEVKSEEGREKREERRVKREMEEENDRERVQRRRRNTAERSVADA